MNQDAEETETSNQANDEDDSVDDPLPDGEEVEVVQDLVATPSPYTCGCCSEGIDLDSTCRTLVSWCVLIHNALILNILNLLSLCK